MKNILLFFHQIWILAQVKRIMPYMLGVYHGTPQRPPSIRSRFLKNLGIFLETYAAIEDGYGNRRDKANNDLSDEQMGEL